MTRNLGFVLVQPSSPSVPVGDRPGTWQSRFVKLAEHLTHLTHLTHPTHLTHLTHNIIMYVTLQDDCYQSYFVIIINIIIIIILRAGVSYCITANACRTCVLLRVSPSILSPKQLLSTTAVGRSIESHATDKVK
ncbi:hypothetical protein LSAT2_032125 [Lamellibrachia satsuma]|nr:hypothetical protein LSAT2_032125 [Lamellibrachia satsuma]